MKKDRFRLKIWFTFLLLSVAFLGVLIRIWYVSVSGNIRLPQWSSMYRPTLRGSILDRNGSFLALTVNSASIFLRPHLLRDRNRAVARLAGAIGLTRDEIRKRLARGRERFAWLMRQVPEQIGSKVKKLNLPGVQVIREPRRVYPGGRLAAHVLGFSGVDHVGLTGTEKSWDRILLPDRSDEKRIRNIVLTLDSGIQQIVEEEILAVRKSSRARNVSAVIMEPHSGEIIAMASDPSFDPNRFTASPESRFVNPAVTRSYEPGSTFKMFTAAFLVQNNLVSLRERFYCPGSIEIYGHKVSCTHRHGHLRLPGILSRSCNVGTIRLSKRLPSRRFHAFLRQLGFGSRPGTGLLGESRGLLHPVKDWSGLSRSMISIGYEISVTPLQLVRAAAALANNGVLMRPRLLKGVTDWQGRILWSSSPSRVRRVCSPYTAHLVLKMLEGTVSAKGTGYLAAVPGVAVSGKTGTAHISRRQGRGYDTSRYNASFLGFLPIGKRKLVILVLVQEPKESHLGGQVAAPAFRKIARRILDHFAGRRGGQ